MPGPELYQIFVSNFNRLGVRYMVTGAAASIVYGEPRSGQTVMPMMNFGSARCCSKLVFSIWYVSIHNKLLKNCSNPSFTKPVMQYVHFS